MAIICPNYRCPQRSQQDEVKVCTACGTNLIIGDKYRLTAIIRTSHNKIDSPEYYWHELFQATCTQKNDYVIKILVIVPDALIIPSSIADIEKVRSHFSQEYKLLKYHIPGICRGYDFLEIPMEGNTFQMQAIVMEKIPGQNLNEYINNYGVIDSSRALCWLKQLVRIIDLMHKRQIQHRDIKPSNIMVSGSGGQEKLTLIDLGIGCDLTNNQIPFDSELGVGTYRDPLCMERGEYLNSSDFYSLGQTFVFLLTGNSPSIDGSSYEMISVLSLDPKLKDVIQRLVSVDVNQRFKPVLQIWRHLLIYLSSRQLKWLRFIYLMLIGLVSSLLLSMAILVAVKFLKENDNKYAFPVCEYVHCGEDINITLPPGGEDYFQKIIEDLPKLNPQDQRDKLKKYEDKLNYRKKKPRKTYNESIGELMIYLNNAKIRFASNTSIEEVFLLLVVVPNYENQSITSHMLSGVAQVQKEFNSEKTIHPLYVAIVQEEKNDPKFKKLQGNISKYLVQGNLYPGINDSIGKPSKLIGVMGHYSSESAFALLKTYKDNKILLVSPSANRTVNSKKDVELMKYFIRVAGNAEKNAGKIEKWLKERAENQKCQQVKISLIYQSDDSASNSLGEELSNKFNSNSKFDIQKIPYELERGDIEKAIEEIKQKMEDKKSNPQRDFCQKALIFFPGPHMTNDQDDLIISMINSVEKDSIFISNIPIEILSKQNIREEINNEDFYRQAYAIAPYNILDFLKQSAEKKIDVNFVKSLMQESMSGKDPDILKVNWRQIATADAMRVFTKAIEQYPQNEKQKKLNTCIAKDSNTVAAIIHDIIKCPGFKVQGVSGEITFDQHERKNFHSGTILKYLPLQGKAQKLVAVPVDYEDTKNPNEYRPREISELKN